MESVSPNQEAPDSSTKVSPSTLEEVKALFRKGQELYSKEDYEGALDAFSRVVDLWPIPPPNSAALAFRFNVGGVLKKMNRCEGRLLEYFRFYLSFKPDMQAEAAQASCLDALGRFGEAREAWLRAAGLSTKQADLQQNFHGLAETLERAERYAESARVLPRVGEPPGGGKRRARRRAGEGGRDGGEGLRPGPQAGRRGSPGGL